VFASYTLAFALQLRKKQGKASVRVAARTSQADTVKSQADTVQSQADTVHHKQTQYNHKQTQYNHKQTQYNTVYTQFRPCKVTVCWGQH
jgi:sialic acid synthase SpsE